MTGDKLYFNEASIAELKDVLKNLIIKNNENPISISECFKVSTPRLVYLSPYKD